MPYRDVVITGLGIVSPLGIGRDAFWSSLAERKSGVRISETLTKIGFPVKIAAEVVDFDGKQYVTPRKSLKVMCREIQVAYAAAALAMKDAGVDPQAVDHDRLGVVLGCDMLYCENEDVEEVYRSCLVDGKFDWQRWGDHFPSKIFPLWMLKYLPNMAACHVGISIDARGPNNTITLGDASSLLAISEAAAVVARGHADVMLAGGTGSRLNVTPLSYRGEVYLSHRNDEPAAASRPFDAKRDGLVNGEGSCILVLEAREHAEARGAEILGQVLACRSSFVAPVNEELNSEQAIHNAIVGALQTAKMSASDIGHVNAHGLSTKIEDGNEARAIRATLGDVPVFAPKSYFGNLGTGGGAMELAASVLGLMHGEVLPTLNYSQPDPDCPVNVVHGQSLRDRPATALCQNQSGTGQAAAVIISR